AARAELLDRAALYLFIDALLLRRAAGFCRHTEFGLMRGFRDHLDEARDGILAICLLRAETVRRDDDDTVLGELRAGDAFKPLADARIEGRRVSRIEAKLRGGRDLVDVLAARPARTDEADGDFVIFNRELVRDRDHGSTRLFR